MLTAVLSHCRAAGELLRARDGEELRHAQAEGAGEQGQATGAEEEGRRQGRGSGEEVSLPGCTHCNLRTGKWKKLERNGMPFEFSLMMMITAICCMHAYLHHALPCANVAQVGLWHNNCCALLASHTNMW